MGIKKFLIWFLIIGQICICISFCGCSKANNEISETRFLMDTVFTVTISGSQKEAAKDAVFKRVTDLAERTDYYSPSSDVSRINNAKKNEGVIVSQDTAVILKKTAEVFEKSDGAFDITVAPVKDLWNFKDDKKYLPSDKDLSAALKYVGGNNILIEGQTVTKNQDNIKIDLGAAVKGYAIDVAKEELACFDIDYALLDFGGSIGVFGKNPKTKDGMWTVGLQKPFGKTGEYYDTVKIKDGVVVTSGIYQRYFEKDGIIYHHILDPKSGIPADTGLLGVSISTKSGLDADCLSTAYMVLGKEKGDKLVSDYGGIAYAISK